MKIYLIGAGPGNPTLLTAEAAAALEASVVVLGSPRLLAACASGKPTRAANTPQQLAEVIATLEKGPVAVLLSGEIGFYSAATRLRGLLAGHELVGCCGIGSMQQFAAALGRAWEGFFPLSLHGRAGDLPFAVRCHRETFLLTGGAQTPEAICQRLCESGMGALDVWVGENLSLSDERITCGKARELAEQTFSPLSVMLVENPHPLTALHAPGLPDDCFIRGKTPMTKREVRALALALLRVQPGETVYDVGAGTGSVSVELAMQSGEGIVYAIERDAGACALIEENRTRFALANLRIVQGDAPDALGGLPTPQAAFIGGSAGSLEAILRRLLAQNPAVRVLVTTVTLERFTETDRLLRELPFTERQITQLAVSRAEPLGRYRQLKAQNPVTLFYACGAGGAG